jgi:hypothetical protein
MVPPSAAAHAPDRNHSTTPVPRNDSINSNGFSNRALNFANIQAYKANVQGYNFVGANAKKWSLPAEDEDGVPSAGPLIQQPSSNDIYAAVSSGNPTLSHPAFKAVDTS